METFPDKDQVVRSVKVLKPDQNEVVVNFKHLIVLELYFELNNPQIYSDTDESTQRESDSEMEEVMSEVDGSVSGSPPARPSRRTAQASRVQTKGFARRGLV